MPRFKTELFFISFLLLIAGLLFFKGIGGYFFWDPWEPKYAKAIKEMIARHDYITPYLNDEIRWTKPILIYWTMLVPSILSGVNEWTIRLPSAVAATFGIFVVYYLLSQLRDKKTAVMGACALATIPQYFYLARQAMPDMLMTVLLTSAMAWFGIARFKPGRENYFYGFYVFMALAFLAKGPVAGAITLLALLLFLIVDLDGSSLRRPNSTIAEMKRLFRYYRVAGGALVFLSIAAPWYVVMLVKHGDAYTDHFLAYENITRFKQPIRGHNGLITYYIQNLFHGMYPWSGFLPAAFLFLFYGSTDLNEEIKQRWYFVSWFLAVFIVFSFAGTKQQHYILPITPYVAILAALVWQEYFKAKPVFWVKTAMVLSALMVWLTIRDFLISGDGYLFDVFTLRFRIDHGDDVEDFLYLFLYAWLLLMLAAIFCRKAKVVIAAMAVLLALLNGVYFTQVVMPVHSEKRTLKPYIDLYQQQSGKNSSLVFYSKRDQSSLYYYYDKSRYHRIRPGQPQELIELIKQNPDTYIIAEKRYHKRLIKILYRDTRRLWERIADSHARYVFLIPPA